MISLAWSPLGKSQWKTGLRTKWNTAFAGLTACTGGSNHGAPRFAPLLLAKGGAPRLGPPVHALHPADAGVHFLRGPRFPRVFPSGDHARGIVRVKFVPRF